MKAEERMAKYIATHISRTMTSEWRHAMAIASVGSGRSEAFIEELIQSERDKIAAIRRNNMGY